MTIITAPHQALRQVAAPITTVDQKLKRFVKDFEKTLKAARNPRGVGLAAPQVNKSWRIFIVAIDKPYICPNPVITAQSTELTLGPNTEEPILEGCLSIPNLYGPVPRHEWVELEYQIIEGNELQKQADHFTDFEARVIQHELDHLNGILFTDYSLKYDLPIYREKNSKTEEVDKSLLELL